MKHADLITYIENMIHTCQVNFSLHQIKMCNEKDAVVDKFLQDYANQRWIPTIEFSKLKYE